MEWLIGIAAFIAFVFWAVWQSGKGNGLQEAASKQAEANGKYERRIAELEEEIGSERRKTRTLTVEIREARSHISALRGGAVDLLQELRATKPPSILHVEPFLLLAPGTLYGYSAWARSAAGVWRRVDELSAQSRRALEEAYLAYGKSHAPPSVTTMEGPPTTPLLRDVLSTIEGQPHEAVFNPFNCGAYDFDELANWFDTLAHLSHSYVVRVAEVESRLRREANMSTDLGINSVPLEDD